MLFRPKFLSFLACAAMTALPTLALQSVVQGQVIFSDDDFQSADYTTSGLGNQDVRFNFDYSSFDVYGDNFLQVTIPDAPRGGGPGVFISANNVLPAQATLSFASIAPTLANVNVGNGTANEDYVMRVDVFHSTGTGIDDGAGNVSLVGTTNYAFLGVNQTNPVLQMQLANDPGGGLAGQGIRLAMTADTGGAEDYVPVVGGALYRDRIGLATVAGRTYDIDDNVDTGLASDVINDFWIDYADKEYVVGDGVTFVTAAPTDDDLNAYRGDSFFFSPDPSNLAGFDEAWDGDPEVPVGVARQYFVEEIGGTTGPTHFTGGDAIPDAPGFIRNNEAMNPGVVYNRWATHELYWVDGTFTYVIDGVPIQEFTPTAGNTPNLANVSFAGTGTLGFWDLFGGSVATSPDGGNFVIYDNLEFEVADAGDVPDMMAYLTAEGYLPAAPGQPGDFDGDDDVDGRDFLAWQRGESPDPLSAGDLDLWRTNYGAGGLAAVTAVPEPSTIMLLLSVAGCGFLGRRRG